MAKKNVWSFIAYRYLRAKKQTQIINILTYLSIISVAFLVAAFIIIISVFNGFDKHFKDTYNKYYADIIVKKSKATDFAFDTKIQQKLKTLDSHLIYSKVLRNKAFANYNDQNIIVNITGVDNNYFKILNYDLVDSNSDVLLHTTGDTYLSYLSYNAASALGVDPNMDLYPIEIQMPQNTGSTQSIDQVSMGYVYPEGVFSTQENESNMMLITDFELIKKMSNSENLVSEIAIKVKNDKEILSLQNDLKSTLGNDFDILTRYQQNETIYKIIKTEKLAVYVILLFMLLLSSLNIIGVLSLTILEKKKDIALLAAMGTNNVKIQNIFLYLGLYIGGVGAVLGAIVGVFFCLGQQYFGWIKMGTSTAEFEYFPVQLQWLNILFVVFVSIVITLVASWVPAQKASKDMVSLRWSE